jgi:hypothetical protein
VQIRRVLLLFALVLGLSAVVASLAPPPEDAGDEERGTDTTVGASPPSAGPATRRMLVRIAARGPEAPLMTRRVREGSSFALEVPVREPGDVVLDGLGLRQTADPHTPAQFYVLASPPGRYAVAFVPVLGDRRVIGHLAFVEPETVTRRPRDRRRSAR